MWNDWSKDVRIAAARALGKTGNGKVSMSFFLDIYCTFYEIHFFVKIEESSRKNSDPKYAVSSFRMQQQQQQHLAVIIRRLNWRRGNRAVQWKMCR